MKRNCMVIYNIWGFYSETWCMFKDDVNLHLITSGETGLISIRSASPLICQYIFDINEFVIDRYAQVDSFNTRLIKNAGLKIEINNSS